MAAPQTDSAIYEIRVERHVGTAVAAYFPDLTIVHNLDGSTTLCGALPDQSALHGVLELVRSLGLTLIAVNRRSKRPSDSIGDDT